MAQPSIDFAGEGLLDGLQGSARAERLALLRHLQDEGVTLEEIRRLSDAGTLIFGAADRVLGDRERIRGMVWAGLLGQAQQALHHPRDLILLRPPASADGGLDLLGRVAGARHAVLAGGEHDHAAGLADGERAARVLAEVQLLERHRVGLVLAQEAIEGFVDVGEAALLGEAGRGVDDAAVERHQAAIAVGDDAVARVGETGIYAEDDHGQ